jgi:predicted nucleic acid-binding protein
LTSYVVDASVMGPLVIPDESGELLSGLLDILRSDEAMVPQHWRLEVANLARMGVRKQRLTEALLTEAFGALAVIKVVVDPLTSEMAWQHTLELAARYDLTAYDAAYLELAGRTRRTLVTQDKALRRATRREGVGLFPA